MFYKPNSFALQELVSPDTYSAMVDRCWELLDPRALVTLQALRDAFGPLVVNDWHVGGSFTDSGLRNLSSVVGAKFSQHRFGRAFDCKFKRATPSEVLEYVAKNSDKFPYLTTIENPTATPTWFHFDVRNHQRSGVWIVNP